MPLEKYIFENGQVKKLTLEEWIQYLVQNPGCDLITRIALDYVGKIKISTVFIGIDHQFLKSGPPLLFETMVFGGELDEFF